MTTQSHEDRVHQHVHTTNTAVIGLCYYFRIKLKVSLPMTHVIARIHTFPSKQTRWYDSNRTCSYIVEFLYFDDSLERVLHVLPIRRLPRDSRLLQ